MCAKDDLIRRKSPLQLAEEPATAESITLQQIKCTLGDINSLFADARLHNLHTRLLFQLGRQYLSRLKADQHFFVYQNILSLITFIISYRPFADKLVYAPSQFFLGNTDYPLVYVIIKNLFREAQRQRSTPSTLLARFIPTTKIRNPLLKKNAAKSRILLTCADRRIRQYYPTICAILANYEEQVLLTSVKKNHHCTRYTRTEQFTQLQQEKYLNKGHNDFIHPVNYTLHLLLKGLVIKMLDFMQDILDDIYPSKQKAIIQQLIAVVSPLFILKAPFALHFIHAVCNLVTLAQYKSHDEDTLAYIQGALERINIFKEEFQVYQRTLEEEKNFNYPNICTRANSKAHHITIVKQFYSITNKKEYILQICLHNSQKTALLAANHATIVKQKIQPHSTKLPLSKVAANIAISNFTHAAAVFSSSKRHNDPKHCNKETLQAFKFYDLSTIIRLVHLVPRDLPNLTTHEYNCLYSPTFNIDLLRTLQEYQQKQTQNN
ncbi:hypothetical protein HBI12_012640 [Parastagonospora nodorum]|nr:hypothetical protein HBI12_012640 [Parastagonospora nodorum]